MSIRRSAALVAVAAAAPVALIATSAQAATAPSSITVKASDTTPASGQTFTVGGLFTAQGKPADHLLVKVESLSKGVWTPLTGAQVDTTSTGTYQLRVILDAKGVRQLRVQGIVPGPARDAFKAFTVTVH